MRLLTYIVALAPFLQGGAVLKTVCTSGCDYPLSNTGLTQALIAVRDYQENTACVEAVLEIEPNIPTEVALALPEKSLLWNANGTNNTTSCKKYVTVRTAAHASLPARGTRVARDSTKLVRLMSGSFSGLAVLTSAWGSGGYWRFQGIEFGITPGKMVGYLVGIGSGTATAGSSLQDPRLQPHHFIFEHVWIHGNPAEDGPIQGLQFHGSNLQVHDSIIEEVHSDSSDAAAFLILSGTGATTFTNNYLAGAGQNWFSGGGIPAPKIIPSDHRVLGNHMEKPFRWHVRPTTATTLTGPCYAGMWRYNTSAGLRWKCVNGAWAPTTDPRPIDYAVKPTIECKNCKDALFKGNYLNNGWVGDQQHNFLLANQVENNVSTGCAGGRVAQSRIENIDFTLNRMNGGYGIIGVGGLCPQNTYFVMSRRIRVFNNLAVDLADPAQGTGSDSQRGRFGFFNAGNYGFEYFRNTVVVSAATTTGAAFGFNRPTDTPESKTFGFNIIRDNIFNLGTSGMTGGQGINGGCMLERNIQGKSFDMRRNVLINDAALPTALNDNLCGGGFRFPTTNNPITTSNTNVVNSSNGYRVKPAYQGKSTEGLDPGADIDMVEWATAGAVVGSYPAYLDMRVRSIAPDRTTVTLHYTAPTTAACTAVISNSATFPQDIGTDTHSRVGKDGKVVVTGLDPFTNYNVRLLCDGYRVEERFRTAQ